MILKMIALFIGEKIITELWLENNATFTSFHSALVFQFRNKSRIIFDYTAQGDFDYVNTLFPDITDFSWHDNVKIEIDEFNENEDYTLDYKGMVTEEQFFNFKDNFVPDYLEKYPVFQPFALLNIDDNDVQIDSTLCHDFVQASFQHFGISYEYVQRDKMIIRGKLIETIPSYDTKIWWHLVCFLFMSTTKFTNADKNFPVLTELFKNGIQRFIIHGKDDKLYVIEDIVEINYCYERNGKLITCAL